MNDILLAKLMTGEGVTSDILSALPDAPTVASTPPAPRLPRTRAAAARFLHSIAQRVEPASAGC